MTPPPNSEEVRDLLGAYALNALDPEERAQVDALLLTDASARAELHELEHAAAWLGHASLRPRADAWNAIAVEIGRDSETPAAPAPTPIRVRRRPAPRVILAAAAAVVIAVAGIAAVVTLADRDAGRAPVAARARAAAREDTARLVTLRSADGRWSARVVVLPDGTGFVRGTAMPEPARGRDLQLWSVTAAGPVSAGVLRDATAWHEFRAARAATAFAVTDEPRGGSRAPTGPPVVSGELGRV
jgi:hypothetical protein